MSSLELFVDLEMYPCVAGSIARLFVRYCYVL